MTVFFFCLCSLLTYIWVPQPEWEVLPAMVNTGPLLGKTICLDPGHGGRDPGAVFGDIEEKDLNLDITRKLAGYLNKQGAKVVLTRSGDGGRVPYPLGGSLQRAELYQRARLPALSRAQLFISIHCNSEAMKVYYGPQTFYNSGDKRGAHLARKIQQELVELRQTHRRALPGKYYLLQNSAVPSVIVEVGFLSHSGERALLISNDYRQRLAQAIGRGIINYYKP